MAVVRRISIQDNVPMAHIIRNVMPSFGAGGKGFAIHDAEVDDLFNAYLTMQTAYFVCEEKNRILGGAGIGPLAGGAENVCELKKMYFLPEGRGQGLGQKVLSTCLDSARHMAFEFCYLETFNTMKGAMRLYERNGFIKIPGPMGSTGHFACDTFYLLNLKDPAHTTP